MFSTLAVYGLKYLCSIYFQKILSFKNVWTFGWMAVGWMHGRIDNCELQFGLGIVPSVCVPRYAIRL